MKNLYILKILIALAVLFGSYSNPIYGQLYPFEGHTFTNAGAEGKSGPLLSACVSAYAGADWASDPAFFNMSTQGIQQPNSVINTWTQSLVITLNLCHEFTPKKMESKREGRDSSLC